MKLSDSVLFLDIDGVLNDQNYRGPGTCGCMELDPERIRILSEIVSLKYRLFFLPHGRILHRHPVFRRTVKPYICGNH